MRESMKDKKKRISLLASAIALAALLITVVARNRSLGFGRSISEIDQQALLVVAGTIFISQALAKLVTKRASKRHADQLKSKGFQEKGTDDEISNAQRTRRTH